MSKGNNGYFILLLIAAMVGFIVLTPRVIQRNGGGSKALKDDSWFQDEISTEQRPVLVKFGATWCGPCQSLDETIESMEPELGKQVKIIRIDVDEYPGLASVYKVNAIPHSFIFHHGQVVDSHVGSMGASDLQAWIEGAISQTSSKEDSMPKGAPQENPPPSDPDPKST